MSEKVEYTDGAAELVEEALRQSGRLAVNNGAHVLPESFDDYASDQQQPFTD